jgi:hypothetical protein
MKRKLAVALATAFGVAAIAAPAAPAGPTKTCIEEGKNKNWVTITEQHTGCPSNPAPHPDEDVANENGGGQRPPGQQPA